MFAMCLVASVLTVLLLLILFSAQSVDLTLQVKSENLRVASPAARNGLELAVAHLREDRDWGKNGEAIQWHDPNTPGATGQIRFAPPAGSSTEPVALQVGPPPSVAPESLEEKFYSVNNLGGLNTVLAFDGEVLVPPNAILLVSVGRYRDTTQIAYQAVVGSPLPFSLASEGALRVTGDTVVGSLESLDEARELAEGEIPLDNLEDSGLVSNDSSLDAITLEGEGKVVGNVEALGQINAESSVSISGEARVLDSPIDIVALNLDEYDPLGDPADPSDDRPTHVPNNNTVVADAIENLSLIHI